MKTFEDSVADLLSNIAQRSPDTPRRVLIGVRDYWVDSAGNRHKIRSKRRIAKLAMAPLREAFQSYKQRESSLW